MSEEILTELRAIRATQLMQGSLLARVDERTNSLNEKIDAHSDTFKEHNRRITTLEHYRTRIGAFVAIISVLVGLALGAAKEALAGVFTFHH